jgi:hypothetical protein
LWSLPKETKIVKANCKLERKHGKKVRLNKQKSGREQEAASEKVRDKKRLATLDAAKGQQNSHLKREAEKFRGRTSSLRMDRRRAELD